VRSNSQVQALWPCGRGAHQRAAQPASGARIVLPAGRCSRKASGMRKWPPAAHRGGDTGALLQDVHVGCAGL